MFVVDMDPQPPLVSYANGNLRIGPVLDVTSGTGLSIDWVSISASGKYAVVSYNGDYPRVYDIDPNTLAMTPKVYPSSIKLCNAATRPASQGYIYELGHADMTLNPFDSMEDVIVGQLRGNCNVTDDRGMAEGQVMMVKLSDGWVTTLPVRSASPPPIH